MSQPKRSSRAKVLFVDDEQAVLDGICQALRRHPFDIVTANSGQRAIEILENAAVDVVVSDERMPNMPGSVFLGVVAKRWPGTIRITLTGQATLEAAIRAVNEGEIFRFLLKPCQPEDLAQTIRQGLEIQELRREAARLLAVAHQRGGALDDLERRHPGITQVERRRDGIIVVDSDQTTEQLIAEIRREVEGPDAGGDASHGGSRVA
jgi:two-component system, probable response regulator PhcQ